jgi:hypothetical protein
LNVFTHISSQKLKEIFDLMANQKTRMPKVEFLQLIDIFFQEFVFSLSVDSLKKEEITAGVENLKCILTDVSKANKVHSFKIVDICNGFIIRAPDQCLRE